MGIGFVACGLQDWYFQMENFCMDLVKKIPKISSPNQFPFSPPPALIIVLVMLFSIHQTQSFQIFSYQDGEVTKTWSRGQVFAV